jgi:hypothetical protein
MRWVAVELCKNKWGYIHGIASELCSKGETPTTEVNNGWSRMGEEKERNKKNRRRLVLTNEKGGKGLSTHTQKEKKKFLKTNERASLQV